MNSYSGQNVAHVKPMPNTNVSSSASGTALLQQSNQALSTDPSQDPKQLYQMVSVNVNGVVKNLMVPISSQPSSQTTSQASAFSAVNSNTNIGPQSVNIHGASSAKASTGIPTMAPGNTRFLNTGVQSVMARPSVAISNSVHASTSVAGLQHVQPNRQLLVLGRQDGQVATKYVVQQDGSKYIKSVVHSTPVPGSLLVPQQLEKSASFASNVGKKMTAKLITQPDGKMMLVGLAGMPPGSQLLVSPQQNKTTVSPTQMHTNIPPPMQQHVRCIPAKVPPMPPLKAAPYVNTTTRVQVPSVAKSIMTSATVQSTASVGNRTTPSTDVPAMTGYLLGNQLVLGQPPEMAQSQVPANAMSNVTNQDTASGFHIDSVYSLNEQKPKIESTGNSNPEVIEILPDDEGDPEESVLRLAKQAAIAQSSMATVVAEGSHISAITPLPDPITEYIPPRPEPQVVNHYTNVTTVPLGLKSLLAPIVVQSNTVSPKTVTVASKPSSVGNIVVQPSIPRQMPAQLQMISPPNIDTHSSSFVKRKSTARKSTAKPHKKFKSQLLMIRPPGCSTAICYRDTKQMQQYWPMLKGCSIRVPRLEKLMGKGLEGKPQFSISQHAQSQQKPSVIPTQDTGSSSSKSQVFKSGGHNVVVTPTGNKTIIQPSATGGDKGKFLMIKTNAGTFLVPVNSEKNEMGSQISPLNENASAMKVLSPVATEEKKDQCEYEVETTKSGKTVEDSSSTSDVDTLCEQQPVTLQEGERKRKIASESKNQDSTNVKCSKSSGGMSRIQQLKEKLRKQRELAEQASKALSETKTVLETIDLV